MPHISHLHQRIAQVRVISWQSLAAAQPPWLQYQGSFSVWKMAIYHPVMADRGLAIRCGCDRAKLPVGTNEWHT